RRSLHAALGHAPVARRKAAVEASAGVWAPSGVLVANHRDAADQVGDGDAALADRLAVGQVSADAVRRRAQVAPLALLSDLVDGQLGHVAVARVHREIAGEDAAAVFRIAGHLD